MSAAVCPSREAAWSALSPAEMWRHATERPSLCGTPALCIPCDHATGCGAAAGEGCRAGAAIETHPPRLRRHDPGGTVSAETLRATLALPGWPALDVRARWTGGGCADVELVGHGTDVDVHVALSALTDDERARLDAVLAAAAQDRARAEAAPVETTAALRARVRHLKSREQDALDRLRRCRGETQPLATACDTVAAELAAAEAELARRAEGEGA